MGEAATETETPIRPGRYLLPLARRLIFPVIIVAELAMGYVNSSSGYVSAASAWVCVSAAVVVLGIGLAFWFVPSTVVDQRGIHFRLIGRYRHILWADAVGFLVVRTWRFARVEVQLPNGHDVAASAAGALQVGPDGDVVARPVPAEVARSATPGGRNGRPVASADRVAATERVHRSAGHPGRVDDEAVTWRDSDGSQRGAFDLGERISREEVPGLELRRDVGR